MISTENAFCNCISALIDSFHVVITAPRGSCIWHTFRYFFANISFYAIDTVQFIKQYLQGKRARRRRVKQ